MLSPEGSRPITRNPWSFRRSTNRRRFPTRTTGTRSTAPSFAPVQPIGPAIELEPLGHPPIVGVCQRVQLSFGVGHTGSNGWQFPLVTATTSFDASVEGTLETPADPSSPVRFFSAGDAAGTSTIDATGYVLDSKNMVFAH